MQGNLLKGAFFALMAALVNGTVGLFSVGIMSKGLHAIDTAFYKCLIAAFILLVVCAYRKMLPSVIRELKENWKVYLICSFFAIFVLYYFETAAYTMESIPSVIFMLLGGSTLASAVLGSILLKEKISTYRLLALITAVIGLFVIFLLGRQSPGFLGSGLAIISGAGYGTYLVLARKFKLKSSVVTLLLLMSFGSILLLPAFLYQGPSLMPFGVLPNLITLAILPTIGGFYFTTKALETVEASRVQIYELSEPIFAVLFSFMFLSYVPNKYEYIGGFIILLALIAMDFGEKKSSISNE